MEVAQVHRLKELKQENGRLKPLVVGQALDNLILKKAAGETSKPDAAKGGGRACRVLGQVRRIQ